MGVESVLNEVFIEEMKDGLVEADWKERSASIEGFLNRLLN